MKSLSCANAAACAVLFLSGCTNLVDFKKAQTVIPFRSFPESGSPAAIYLWPPYTSAAIVDKEGNRCVLGASGVQTSDVSTENAVKASQILDKLSGLDATTKSRLVEQFVRISQADSRAAAVDVALFHLCILDQNGTFKGYGKPNDKGPAVLDAYKFTVERALNMIPVMVVDGQPKTPQPAKP